MTEKEDTYIELIEKYLVNEASEEEILELKRLIDSDENIKQSYLNMLAVVELSEAKVAQENINIDVKFQEFLKERKEEDQEEAIPVIPLWSNLLKVAAILILASGLWYISSKNSDQPNVVVEASEEQTERALADGSLIILNKNSTISYPQKFKDNLRLVALTGEAYFEVESDPERPFIIEVGTTRVQVMGTKFNVNGYNEDSVVVTVVEGSVLVYTEGKDVDSFSKKDYITEGYKGSVIQDASSSKKELNDNLNFLFWYDGKLRFQEEPLLSVINKLNKEWNTNFILESAGLNNCPLTTTFTQSSIEYIIELISLTLDVSIESNTDGQIISGEGC
ncbi:MAG: FecR family protein [Flavobacteriales bacterium]|nr:FecR family protein [Flavobacteriales bacterium]